MTVLASFNVNGTISVAEWADLLNLTTVGSSATQNGITVEILSPFSGAFSNGSAVDQDWYGVPLEVLVTFGSVSAGAGTQIKVSGLNPSLSGAVRFGGAISNANRDRLVIIDGVTTIHENPGGTNPLTPELPVDAAFTADANGEVIFTLDANNINAAFPYFQIVDNSPVGPTITDINTTNEVTPGSTATLTGTNLTNPTGINIGSVSQTGFTVVNDTTVTFTGTRGGNPYNQDLTATLLSPDGDATITVQQVPEAGTFAVTAASPNTTDDASLWANTVDTSTGDPVTVVNGDQFWVNSTIPGLAIDPTGAITANETGTLTGQFWRASEGVWGSDQTVTFEVPDDGGGTPVDPVTPDGQSIRNTVRNSARNTVRSTRRTL